MSLALENWNLKRIEAANFAATKSTSCVESSFKFLWAIKGNYFWVGEIEKWSVADSSFDVSVVETFLVEQSCF